ncbi:hypothetical protein HNV12_09740 [Methanococcoides sp. SA1]|nr:hypothetical protein [Methanococcoides sp. SA1]
MRSLFKNDKGVSSTTGYLLYSSIFIMFFVVIHFSVNDVLLDRQSDIVIEEGFSDIGNMMSTTLTDMYLVAPENGKIDTKYMIPTTIGNEYYTINADVATTDQLIGVESQSSQRKVDVTISGIASTVPINGTALSGEMEHMISYDSRRQ